MPVTLALRWCHWYMPLCDKSFPMLDWPPSALQLPLSRSTVVDPLFRMPKAKTFRRALAIQPSGGLLTIARFVSTATVSDTWPAIVTLGGIGIRHPMGTPIGQRGIMDAFKLTGSHLRPPVKTFLLCRHIVVALHLRMLTSPVHRSPVAHRLARPNFADQRRRLTTCRGKTR